MLSANLTLQVMLAISSYCSLSTTKYWNRDQISCFKKLWTCSHDTTNASTIPFLLNNCISKDPKEYQ